MSDKEFADESVVMQLVEVTREGVGDELPLTYDPDLIKAYWTKRPVSIVKRIFQLLSKCTYVRIFGIHGY